MIATMLIKVPIPGKIANFIVSAMLYESYSTARHLRNEVASLNALRIHESSY